MLAVVANHLIFFAQRRDGSHPQGLLADIEVHKAADFAQRILLRRFFLEAADQEHLFKHPKQLFAAKTSQRHLPNCHCPLLLFLLIIGGFLCHLCGVVFILHRYCCLPSLTGRSIAFFVLLPLRPVRTLLCVLPAKMPWQG